MGNTVLQLAGLKGSNTDSLRLGSRQVCGTPAVPEESNPHQHLDPEF